MEARKGYTYFREEFPQVANPGGAGVPAVPAGDFASDWFGKFLTQDLKFTFSANNICIKLRTVSVI